MTRIGYQILKLWFNLIFLVEFTAGRHHGYIWYNKRAPSVKKLGTYVYSVIMISGNTKYIGLVLKLLFEGDLGGIHVVKFLNFVTYA